MALETPKWLQGGTYSARLDRNILATLWFEGVLSVADFKVTQRGAGANMSVDIAAGQAYIDGDDETDQGTYLCRSTAVENVAVTNNVSGSARIDRVVVQVNDPTAGGAAGDDFTVEVLAGTPGAGAPPALPDSAISLATISVANGATSIVDANITDTRPNAGRRDMPGTLMVFSGSAAPNGWLLCDGSTVSRTTYARLFAMLNASGLPFGVGDGTTTFTLPDLRGKVPVPYCDPALVFDSGPIGQIGGARSKLTPEHLHTVAGHAHTVNSHTHTINHSHTASTASAGAHQHNIETRTPYNISGYGSGFDNVMTISTNDTYATNSAGSHSHSVTVATHSGSSGSASPVTTSTALITDLTGDPTFTDNNMQPYQVVFGYYICT